jgi:hypothetical protein
VGSVGMSEKQSSCKSEASSLYVQGGKNISGTLSKLHHRIKKSYFLLIISHKTFSAHFRRGNKKKHTRSVKY